MSPRFIATLTLTAALVACQPDSPDDRALDSAPVDSASELAPFELPVQYHELDNGLKVVLSQDTTAPVVTVAVYYNIGFRIEPRNRTGFAHLFEHMMFQGSGNLGKMEFIKLVQRNGGVLNGSTRFDFTNYFEIVPAHKLETMLWAEADRMRSLDITQANLENQQGVVKNEVKVNVLNTPYGGFPWLDLPQAANENWYNAHNFYGDLDDLDAANLDDVAAFFKQYYAPNNAAIAVVGDFDYENALNLIDRYFSDIPASPDPIVLPDIAEPRQEVEKRRSRTDPLATRPGFSFAYHVPERLTPEWYAMGLIDQILVQGDDSWLYQALVKDAGITSEINGGINWGLGNMLNYKGPMLWLAWFLHDPDVDEETILDLVDSTFASLRSEPVDMELLDRAKVKWRSGFYDNVSQSFGFGRADLLASLALFDDEPARINEFEEAIQAVTPELVLATAREYLRPTNRTVFVLEAGAAEPTAEVDAND